MDEPRGPGRSFRSFAIVPAAGRSLRMQRPKLLLPWGDSTVIHSVVKAWQTAAVTRVVVVVRPDDTAMQEVCRELDIDVVVPAVPPLEMKHSIELGLRHVAQQYRPSTEDVWLLAPADMPRLSSVVIQKLLEAHRPLQPSILAPVSAGRRGHPVLLPWPLADEVARLTADEGVNALLARHEVVTLACQDPTVLEDIDTPSDYRRLGGELP